MKLTFNFRKELVLAAEADARWRGCILSDLAEEGLRKAIAELEKKHRREKRLAEIQETSKLVP